MRGSSLSIQVDAVATWEPSITRMADNGVARILADGTGVLRGENMIFGRTEYLKENPTLVRIFLEQYTRGNQELCKNTAAAAEKIADNFKLTPEQLQNVVKKYDYSIKVTSDDVADLQGTVTFLRGTNTIKTDVDIQQFADPSYADSADLSQYKTDYLSIA